MFAHVLTFEGESGNVFPLFPSWNRDAIDQRVIRMVCCIPWQLLSTVFVAASTLGTLAYDDLPEANGPTNAVEAGHSLHGEAFNEGPRQSARLIPGTGRVKLKIS